jgi:hypothetical protein
VPVTEGRPGALLAGATVVVSSIAAVVYVGSATLTLWRLLADVGLSGTAASLLVVAAGAETVAAAIFLAAAVRVARRDSLGRMMIAGAGVLVLLVDVGALIYRAAQRAPGLQDPITPTVLVLAVLYLMPAGVAVAPSQLPAARRWCNT